MRGIRVQLKKQLGDFELDVEWDAGPGVTALFGYSGAGKSITLAMISGIMRPDHGWVVVDDMTYTDTRTQTFLSPQQRRVGLVSQVADLFPHLSVRANVEYGLFRSPKHVRAERADRLLESFQIADLADKRPSEVSGGQHQRVALARALAPEPRVLLLDEPFSALDLPIRLEMRELIMQVQRDYDIPVVMVTHDLGEAVAMADRMVVYSGTGHVQTGTPQEVLACPGTPEIERLLACAALQPGFARQPIDQE